MGYEGYGNDGDTLQMIGFIYSISGQLTAVSACASAV